MRRPRVRLRTMMAAVAFLAMALAILVQSVQIHQALLREQRLRAEAESQRVQIQRIEIDRRYAQEQLAVSRAYARRLAEEVGAAEAERLRARLLAEHDEWLRKGSPAAP